MKPKNNSLNESKIDIHKMVEIDFRRIGRMVLHPHVVFTSLQAENKKAEWLSPILVVCAVLLLSSLLSVTASTTTSAAGGSSSSSSASGFGPGSMGGGMPGGGGPGGEMGMQTTATAQSTDEDSSNTTESTASSTSSSLLIKILSALGSVAGFLLTWLILGSLINLFSITFGGQANTHMAMVFAAWSTIPIGIRGLMQIIYALATSAAIQAVGLSGFAPTSSTNLAILLTKLLEQIDVYFIWQVILLVIGIGILSKLDRRKHILIALSSTVTIVLIKCLLGLGLEKLSSLNLSSSMLNRLIR